MNSVHTVKILALGKALNENVDYLMYYPSRQYVKLKTLQLQVYIQNNDFMKKKKLDLYKL